MPPPFALNIYRSFYYIVLSILMILRKNFTSLKCRSPFDWTVGQPSMRVFNLNNWNWRSTFSVVVYSNKLNG